MWGWVGLQLHQAGEKLQYWVVNKDVLCFAAWFLITQLLEGAGRRQGDSRGKGCWLLRGQRWTQLHFTPARYFAVLWMTALGLSLLLLLQGRFLAGATGCVGTWKELALEAGKGARASQCGLCRSGYFPRSTSVFPQKVSSLPSIEYRPLTKSHSPLAPEHLTLFFRLNVEGKWCLSPVPPSNPFLWGLALAFGRQTCSLLIGHSAHSQHEPKWGQGIMWVS